MQKINELKKEEVKKMLITTAESDIEHAIEFAFLILNNLDSFYERMIFYDITTALSLKDVEYAKRLIKNW